jgi:MATE family multidrug resistance protein
MSDAAYTIGPKGRLGHRAVLAIAVPIMASNVSEPLIGVVDTAILGQLGDAYYIGAIAVGSVIFSFLFWAFGFLRMGTSGLTAQASGAGDDEELRATLGRALLLAAIIGGGLIVLSPIIADVAFVLIEGSNDVETHARSYFDIRIWSAPAALANYAFLGWFIGLGRAYIAFILQLILNLTNIALDAVLVLGLDMGVEGVAIGTVGAQVIAALAGAWLVWRETSRRSGGWSWARVATAAQIRRTIAVNTDILIRTLCLIFAFTWFTAQAAKSGDIILAANAVLFNITMVVTYMLDGFAFAAETLSGQAAGARDRQRFLDAVRLSSLWAVVGGALMSFFVWFGGGWAIDLLTVNEEIRDVSRVYLMWAAMVPLAGVACFQFDGIYIGVTRTADMRNMMLFSVVVYFAAWWALTPVFANHGLWASLIIFFVIRGITLGARFPALLRATFAAPA